MALLRRYGGVRCGTVYERLAALRQKGGVEEYVQEFELRVAQATSTSEDQLLGYFLVGLRQNIRSKILPHDPRELVRAMELACDIEETKREENRYGESRNRGSSGGFRFQSGGGTMVRSSSSRGTNQNQQNQLQNKTNFGGGQFGSSYAANKQGKNSAWGNRNKGIRNFSYQEFVRRDDKLCFQCGGPFGTGHKCPEKSIRVMILAEDEQINEKGDCKD